ncbi:MAG: isochorismatase family protein [Acetobacteraceae bacterium]|nr:isochorismatase family protein [Acetobacteraceae bacterium]MBV8592473.1 isochorismatase family protein [Acetobacteraceae bacterium]
MPFPTLLAAEQSALMLIDFQERLVPAIDGGQAVVAQAQHLAQAARLLGVPVLATEQLPDRLGPTVAPLRDLPLAVIPKAEFDAWRAANVRSALPPDRATIVLAGCEAHVCVLQTAFGLLEAARPSPRKFRRG